MSVQTREAMRGQRAVAMRHSTSSTQAGGTLDLTDCVFAWTFVHPPSCPISVCSSSNVALSCSNAEHNVAKLEY